jgi:transposase
MSTSLIYHGWGIKGYTLKSTEYGKDGTKFHIEPQKRLFVCPVCGSTDVTTRGSHERTIKTLPIGFKEDCYVVVTIPRLHCHSCDNLRYMELNFAEQRKSYTKQLANYIIMLYSVATMLDIVRIVGLHWTTIKEIIKLYLEKTFSKPDLRNITMISIDEISIKKGHNYITIVIDAVTGQPLYVGDGKGEEALEAFWTMLGPRRRKRIQAVAIDMGRAYISAVQKNLPNARIVFDRFHVMKLVNDTLDRLRRKVYATATDDQKLLLKGSKYIILSDEEKLNDKKAQRLKKLLDLNTTLTAGYILKEDLRQFWEKNRKKTAEKCLQSWLKTARSSGEKMLIKLADSIENHSYGLLNWYEFPINSGRIEGINNKIKLLKRKAFGFHDIIFFKLHIMAIKQLSQNISFRIANM